MSDVVLPKTLVAGTPENIGDVWDNLVALRDKINGGVDFDNLAAALQELLVNPGTVVASAAITVPSGYLPCDGRSLLRSSYTRLFAAINTTYGAADSDHFALPDLRGRVMVGPDSMAGLGGAGDAGRLTANEAVGSAGGFEKHTLTDAELPAHRYVTSVVGGTQMDDGPGALINPQTFVDGAGSPHNNMPPYVVVHHFIKT